MKTTSFPISFGDNVLFKSVSNNSEALVALNKQTGNENWRYEVSNLPGLHEPFHHKLSFLWTPRWLFFHKLQINLTLLPREYPKDAAPFVYKNRVYCSFRNGKLVVFPINKKQPLWEYNIPSTDLSSPMVYALPQFKNSPPEAEKELIAVKASDGYTYYFAP